MEEPRGTARAPRHRRRLRMLALPSVALLLVVGGGFFMMSTLLGMQGGGPEVQAEFVAIGQFTAGDNGPTRTDAKAVREASQSRDLPWQILAALLKTQAGSPDQPGGPYRIRPSSGVAPIGQPTISDEQSRDLGTASQYIAAVLANEVDGEPGFSGVNSLVEDAYRGDKGMQVPVDAELYKQRRATFVGALTNLPIEGADDQRMGSVYDTAQAWALGQIPDLAGGCGTSMPISQVEYRGGAVAGLTADQTQNAAGIVQAAAQKGLDQRAGAIGITAAIAESGLLNYANDGTSTLTKLGTGQGLTDAERAVARQSLQFPHQAVGNNLDSMGLFQQRPGAGWGPPEVLMQPVSSAGLFFDRLAGVAGWQTMDPWMAAQTVQGSSSSDGGIYRVKYPQAEQIVQALQAAGAGSSGGSSGAATPSGSTSAAASPAPSTSGSAPNTAPSGSAPNTAAATGSPAVSSSGAPSGSGPVVPVAGAPGCSTGAAPAGLGGSVQVVLNGPTVTIPNHPNVDPAIRGKQIKTPNAKVAKGIAAGLRWLGTPYVWGGGEDGSGPTDGCSRGGGAKNSCQGIIGFDCSGLTAYVLVQGGFPSPGGNSSAQRAAGTTVPYSSGAPGDLVGFPGHIAVYLGVIDGAPWILQASTVGVPIQVVQLKRSDRDDQLHRYWN